MNIDLDTISKRAADWLVDFNPAKTISLLVTRKLQPQFHLPFEMNSIALKETSTYKHLGITFSSSCTTRTWSEHINDITETAWKRLNIIRAYERF